MIRRDATQQRLLAFAARMSERTARAKPASGRRIDRRGRLALHV